MNLNDFAKKCHDVAESKGWYNPPPLDFLVHAALFHTEISEAVEESRHGHEPTEIYYSCGRPDGKPLICGLACEDCIHGKPEGVPIELADLLIRVFDSCAYYGIDIQRAVYEKMEFNKTRTTRHGGKRL